MLQALVNLPDHSQLPILNLNLGGKGSLWPLQQSRKNLPSLVEIIINGLFSKQDQVILLLDYEMLEHAGHDQRLKGLVHSEISEDVDRLVGPDRQ